MGRIKKAYERAVIWIIGTLAETIIRSEPIDVVKKLNLQPFMNVVRGEEGIRFIGIYCDSLWKAVNDYIVCNGEVGEDKVVVKIKTPKRPTKRKRSTKK